MKKIYSFALAAVAILSAASCQKELVNDETLLGGGNFTVTAVASADSKAVLDALNTYWTPGDKISVFDASGAAVQFGTSITENAASAQFTNEADFTAPENIFALSPAKGDATMSADGVIGILRIAGTQTAVAGSFDPQYAVAVGTEVAEGKVAFNHVNCLFKFTVGGKTAPEKVVLTNGGSRNISGQYKYNVETGDVIQLDENGDQLPGAKGVTLNPAPGESFEVGKTYYIEAIPGGNFADITLAFDETVVKTLEGAKYADQNANGKFIGKIINLGTVCFPGEEVVEPEVKKVSVAEFLAAAEDETMYELTGVITRMYQNSSNDLLYGNFYLKDETAEVLIYGLCSPEGVNKYWAESGAKIGDTITIQTVRTSFSGSPQGKNAIFVGLTPFVEEASEWGIVGDLTGWGNSTDPAYKADLTLYTTWKAKDLFVAYDVEIASGAFKIRANNEWNDAKNYGLEIAGSVYADKYYKAITGPASKNVTPLEYGKYDVYFDLANERVAIVTPGKEYADAIDGGNPVVVVEGLKEHTWGLVGVNGDWNNDIAMEIVGDYAIAKNVTIPNGNEFKFRADGGWDLSYGSACDVNVGETYITHNGGNNMKFVGETGAYNLYFSLVDASFYMEAYSDAPTFESNVTFETVTNAYTDNKVNVNKVEGVANLKLGKSTAFGEGNVTLPAGTTKVTYYAVGWSGKSAKLEFSVGGTAVATQEVAANAGATGNGPYEITVTDSDKYVINLGAALEAETVVTVKTIETGYRAFIFGVVAE